MLEIERYGPVHALRQGRAAVGRNALMTVRCYAIDGLLVDCGMPPHRPAVLDFVAERRVRRVALTHHHEDHSGNARALLEAGLEVAGSPGTRARLVRGFAQNFYQVTVWGRTRRADIAGLADVLETEHHRFEVIAAPGHSVDQVVYFERREGWLFSGDAYLGERIKLFRRDEDFRVTLETLRRLTELEIDSIFCAHRPVATGGRAALRRKLDYLLELESEVRRLHADGLSVRAVTRRLLGREDLTTHWLTAGDASKGNLVRSILFGPTRRER
ncbi:MAG: MBL fold metallo-hydrolase [Myxococcota bacterium]